MNQKIHIIESAEKLSRYIGLLKAQGVLGTDIETDGLCPILNDIMLIQLSDDENTLIIDVKKIGYEATADYLRPILESTEIIKCFHNAKFDMSFIWQKLGIKVERIFDSMLASILLQGGIRMGLGFHTLKQTAERHTGIILDKTEQSGDWTQEFTEAKIKYAAEDAQVLLPLREEIIKKLQQFGLIRVAKLEFDCVLPVVWLELSGFYLDFAQWKENAVNNLTQSKIIAAEIYKELQPVIPQASLFGNTEINLDSHIQIQKYFRAIGIPMPDSTKEPFLTPLVPKYPLLGKLLEYRGLAKSASTFGEGWAEFINSTTGRIHADFWQIGAEDTGRFSCVPMTTTALTKKGWKGYDELVIGEKILAYDLVTKTQVWTSVLNKTKLINQPVGSFGLDTRRLRCTPDHKWVVRKSHGGAINGKYYEAKEALLEANNIKSGHRVVMNASYLSNSSVDFDLFSTKKYSTDYISLITQMSNSQLNSLILGFLLADGHNTKPTPVSTKMGWQWTQARTVTREQLLIATYLQHEGRIGVGRHHVSVNENQTSSDRVNLCMSPYMAVDKTWEYENHEDVWCPTTKYGTWVMRQGDFITITGNCSKPNLQQLPKENKFRNCFKAEEGNTLISGDYSQIELRLLADIAQDKTAIAEFAAGKDFHTATSELINRPRTLAKNCNFAIPYGAMAPRVAATANISVLEAEILMDAYFKAFPNFKKWINQQKRNVLRTHYARSVSGRLTRLIFDENDYGMRAAVQRNAVNMPIQGSSADVLKRALRLFYDREAGRHNKVKLVNIVHDEINVECPDELAKEVANDLNDCMVKAGEEYVQEVQIKVDIKSSKFWSKD